MLAHVQIPIATSTRTQSDPSPKTLLLALRLYSDLSQLICPLPGEHCRETNTETETYATRLWAGLPALRITSEIHLGGCVSTIHPFLSVNKIPGVDRPLFTSPLLP